MKVLNKYGIKLRYSNINTNRFNLQKTTQNMNNSQYPNIVVRQFGFKIDRMNNQLHHRKGKKVTDKIGYEILHRKCLC